MSVVLKKSDPPIEWGKSWSPHGGPLTWRRVVPHPDRPKAFADDLALVVCANGHELTLSAKVHRVAADGTVRPSYVCTSSAGCSFHEMVTLEGWEP